MPSPERRCEMDKKYVAYVGSYSYTGEAKGITIYDVDVEKGSFSTHCEVEVDNSSYLTLSRDSKTLYSIADEGVVAFRILDNGALNRLNAVKIKGMRGCHLATDLGSKYIFVSGYHDGKLTVLSLNPDGSIGKIVDGVYHQGLGSIAERNFRPHISCTRRTPDSRFVMAADLGIDQVKIYRFDDREERLLLVDAIRCEINSGPRFFKFSKDGRFLYLMYEMKNVIDVFSYSCGEKDRLPVIERIQTVESTGLAKSSEMTAATCLTMSPDESYLFCGNAGDDAVCVYKRESDTGILEPRFCLPVSGSYPKDIVVFPDQKHIASINHESGSITFFSIDFDNNLIAMCAKSVRVNQPNCCSIVEVHA